jgi:hypothetical protein
MMHMGIVTKKGDKGKTSLYFGGMVPKTIRALSSAEPSMNSLRFWVSQKACLKTNRAVPGLKLCKKIL